MHHGLMPSLHTPQHTATVRIVGAVDCAWGLALALRGRAIWAALAGQQPNDVERGATRLLAARHLIQGSAQLALPEKGSHLWPLVSALHSASMVVLALRRSPTRRPAALSAVYAGTAAAITWPRQSDSRARPA
jgi:hypothetical protein